MERLKRGQCGFTLIEILIVVAIIGLIAALIGPNLMGRFERAKEEIAKALIGNNRQDYLFGLKQEYESYLFFQSKTRIVLLRTWRKTNETNK